MPINLSAGVRVAVRQPVPPRWAVTPPTTPRVAVLPVRGPTGQAAATIRSGHGAPGDDVPLLSPLDGTNDPFRWCPRGPYWVGPPVEVTWSDGDVVQQDYALGRTVWLVITASGDLADFVVDESFDYLATLVEDNPDLTLSTDGTGVAFLVQLDNPDPDLDALDYLGDVTPGAATTFPDADDLPPPIGNDGDFYLDLDDQTMYGPKTNGLWGPGVPLIGAPGAPGTGAGHEHTQDAPSTVWDIEHQLGYDPAGIRVEAVNGDIWFPTNVVYLTPGQLLRLTFPESIAGTAFVS